MCVVMDYAEKQGEKKGLKLGRRQGRHQGRRQGREQERKQGYGKLWQAVQNQVITPQQAAGICKMSVEEFQEKLKEYKII